MNRYDTTFIVNPQIGDDAVNASVNAITEIITSNKGEVLRERRIGSRRLAYPIARQSHGYYVSLIHDCEPSVLPILERHFKLTDAYIRELTIRYDGDPFRKSITDVMMGADSEDRRHSNDGDSGDERRPKPRPRSAAPAPKAAASAPAAAPAPKAAAPAPAPAPKAAEESKESEAPAPIADASGDETL